jgi:hypothetical protein
VRRLDNEGLSGVCVELLALVFNSARPFLFLRVNVNPRGRVMGEPGRENPAEDEDSEPDSGYVASSRGPLLLVRLRRPCRSSSDSTF